VLGRVPGTTGQFADVERSPANTPLPGIAIVRVDGGLFFANADAMRSAVHGGHARPADEELERRGVKLVIARDIGQVRDVLRSEDGEALVEVHTSVQDAVDNVTKASAPRR